MRESLLAKLVLVLSRATPEELAAIYHFATGEPLESKECGVLGAEAEVGLGDDETTDRRPLITNYKTTVHGPQDSGGEAESKLCYVFRWTGRDWEVVLSGGRMFRVPSTLGARYLN